MRSSFTAKKFARSRTSRLNWSRTLQNRPSSRSRHPAAQRAARIAAAADRHRRRAQGHQPLDVRPADRAQYAGGIGGAAVRGGQRAHLPPPKCRLSTRGGLWLLRRVPGIYKPHRPCAEPKYIGGTNCTRKTSSPHPGRSRRPGIYLGGSPAAWGFSHHARRAVTA